MPNEADKLCWDESKHSGSTSLEKQMLPVVLQGQSPPTPWRARVLILWDNTHITLLQTGESQSSNLQRLTRDFPAADFWGTQDQLPESLGAPARGRWRVQPCPGCLCSPSPKKTKYATKKWHKFILAFVTATFLAWFMDVYLPGFCAANNFFMAAKVMSVSHQSSPQANPPD